MAPNPLVDVFKLCKKIVSKYADYSFIIKSGVTELFFIFSYNHLKVKLRLLLTSYTVAMVTYYVEKMTVTCLLFLVSLLLYQLIKRGSIDPLKCKCLK